MIPVLNPRIEIFSEIPEKMDYLCEYGEFSSDLYFHKKMKTDKEIAKAVLPEAREVLNNITEWTFDNVHDELMKLVEKKGMKTGQIFWCVRVAISGKESTAGGVMEIADIIGKKETIKRMDFAINLLNKE